jgi:hypothetical protein
MWELVVFSIEQLYMVMINIPAPPRMVSKEGTQKGSRAPYWLVRKDGVQTCRRFS